MLRSPKIDKREEMFFQSMFKPDANAPFGTYIKGGQL